MIPETCHGAAAALADLGWSVFPTHEPDPHDPSGCSCHDMECHERKGQGKHPRTPRGCLDATRDFDVIDLWWSRWPGAGVGVATGEPSGVWVLDIDPGGTASLAELPTLPPTAEARTGRGHHVYFRMPDHEVRNSAGRVGPGLDVRGTGGYVVVPPSRHVSGRTYQWLHDPFEHHLADAPDWLIELVLTRPPETFPEPRDLPQVYGGRYVRAAIEAECAELARTPEGQRNDQLNRSAYSLARFVQAGDIDAGTVARYLAAAAARAGLATREITLTLRSAFRARGAA